MRARVERLFCAANGLFGKRKLSSWGNGNLIDGTDGLPSCCHHAPDAVNLVSEELNAHRTCSLGWEDINCIAVNVEGSRSIYLACIGVSHAHEQRSYVLKGDVVANGERRWKKIT